MLTKPERDLIIFDLSDHVAPPSSVGALIRIIFDAQERVELGDLPLDLTRVTDQATWLVDACLTSRWRRNPSLLERLLDRLIDIGGKGGLTSIRARVQRREDPNPDPFRTHWVLAHQPFLSRPALRKAAKDLVEGVNQPILRVNGPSKSGKSYTTELLSYVSTIETRPDLHVVPVELAPGTGPTYKVEELAESLTLTMKTDPFPERSNSSYPKALARWLIRSVNQHNLGLWIFVLDGFGQPNVQDEVLEFIHLLAQYMFKPEYARKMRLVLLHFEKDLIGNWRAWTVDDGPLVPNGVTAQDLIDCITAFNAEMQAQNDTARMIAPEDIPTIVDNMIATSKSASFQLPSLYEQLRDIARP